MDHEKLVRDVAENMGVKITDGKFEEVDSLTVVAFISALERKADVTFPADLLDPTLFFEVANVVALLDELTSSSNSLAWLAARRSEHR